MKRYSILYKLIITKFHLFIWMLTFISSTKYIFDILKDYIDTDCIFDELVNYPGFDGEIGELKAFYEFITENKVDYEWIGMNGKPTGMSGYYHENVALIIHSIN